MKERRGHTKLSWFHSQIESSPVPLYLQDIFTIITEDYNLLKNISNRLPILKHKVRDFYAQTHKKETYNAQAHMQEISMLKHLSKRLQILKH